MIFSELYGSYYRTVAKILRAAVDHPLEKGELREIVAGSAFGESALSIVPALEEQRWQLLRADGTTPLRYAPDLPLTALEKRWLKAISLDPRIRLFGWEFPGLEDVEPLFTPEDYFVYDRYSDGDPYEDEGYIRRFRMILDAVRHRAPLIVDTANRRGRVSRLMLLPEYLEYSEKDDKFRLIASGNRYGSTINLGRIVSCTPCPTPVASSHGRAPRPQSRTVEFELTDRRNALERVLLHFAHFEKEAERLEDGRYLVRIVYDRDDETEMVIRILSFGQMVKVVSPESFVELIKDRLIRQKSCE